MNDLTVALQLSCMINKGQYKRAMLQGLDYLKDKSYEIVDAEVGFQVALACSLAGDTRSLPWSELDRFAGFTDRMAGDAVRDQALEAIRRKDTKTGREFLRIAKGFTMEEDDNNRRIVLTYVEGRLYAAEKKNRVALDFYDQALKAWSLIESPNEQWVQNCRFHRLHVLARLNGPGRWRETAAFCKSEPSRKKRVVAWIFALIGAENDKGQTGDKKWH